MPNFPSPIPTQDTEPFWQGLRDGKLLLQRCLSCRAIRYPPRPMCSECNSVEAEWVPASGRGSVYSYTVTHQALHPTLVDRIPHVVILVELEEGVRLTSNILDCQASDVYIGMPVEVVLGQMTDEVTLPKFRPRREDRRASRV